MKKKTAATVVEKKEKKTTDSAAPSKIILLPHWLAITIITTLGIIIYSNTFDCSFQFDDMPNIVFNTKLKTTSMVDIWQYSQNRFTGFYSLALNYHFGQLNVWGYHLVNLIIHLINACLVYWLVLLMFGTPVLKKQEASQYKNTIAFIMALLFVAHPLATQSVTYIIQRLASMVTLFYLLSLALYVKARITENTTTKYLCFSASFVAGVLALVSKENAYTLPLTILLFEICFIQTRQLSFNIKDKRLMLSLAVLVILVMIAISRFSLSIFQPIQPSLGNSYTITSSNYLLTQFSVIVKYMSLLLLPINFNLDYDYPIAYQFFEWRTLVGFLIIMSLLIAGFILFNKQRILSFGIFWFFITLSIESSFIPISDVIFEHRTYLPSFGFLLVVVWTVYLLLWKKARIISYCLFALITITYARLTYARNEVWIDEETLLTDIVTKSPNKARPKVNLGMVYMNRGEFGTAFPYFTRAAEINRDYFDAWNNAGAAALGLSQWNTAITYLTRATKLDSTSAKSFYGLGWAYGEVNEWDKSIACHTRAIALRTNYADAYAKRALMYSNLKEWDKAFADYDKAISIDPKIANAYCNRGTTYGINGNTEKAIADFSKAIEFAPDYQDAYGNRALSYTNLGKWELAIKDYDKLIQLNPNNNTFKERRTNAARELEKLKVISK
jgi:tetratricopeptide (TPR) repeat protein